jgi:hypothetical protein
MAHCKKGYRFSRPQAGCHLPNSVIIPGQGEFLSDIPAGDGENANLFLQCILYIVTISDKASDEPKWLDVRCKELEKGRLYVEILAVCTYKIDQI